MSPALCVGSLLAVYYFVGRWTFARLDADQALAPMVEQPRFWIVALLVAAAMALHTSASRRVRRFRPASVDLAIFAFLAYLLTTCIWATDLELASAKAYELSLVLIVAMVVAVARSYSIDDVLLTGFWTTFVAIGMFFAVLSLLHGGDDRSVALGGGPNTFGRNMGLMAFGALYLASRYGVPARLLAIGVVAVSALLIVRCGSRGGLLSFAAAGSVYVLLTNASITKKACVVAAMVLTTALVLHYTEPGRQAIEVFNGRIIELTIERQHLAGRGDLWTQALQLFVERPLFGWGLDGFRANSWNYPHNIFLEVMVEGGAVGLLLFLNVFRTWRGQCKRSPLSAPSVSLVALVLTMTAAQTSGDLFDSRGVFLMLALATPPRFLTSVRSWPGRNRSALAPRSSTVAGGIDDRPNVI